MVNDFRIEKSRLPVELTLSGGEVLAGDLFVQASAKHRFEMADAPEVMNSAEPFFPLRILGGETLLVAREQVRDVRVAFEHAAVPDWAVGTVSHVRITLLGGAMVEGRVHIEAISARARVLDVLNYTDERFFPVFLDRQLILINRASVVHVQELSHAAA